MQLHPEYAALKQAYFKGWQTWNVRSILSQVHMPEGFAINLAVKEAANGHYLKESLIGRFGEQEEKVFPGPHAYDNSYTEATVRWGKVAFSVETGTDGDDVVMLVTDKAQYVKNPLLVLEGGFLWNRPGTVSFTGASLVAESGAFHCEVFTTGTINTRDKNVPTQAAYLPVEMDGQVGFSTGKARSLSEIRAILDANRAKLTESWQRFGELSGLYEALQCAMAWDTIYDAANDRVISPVSRLWSIGSGGYVLFCWDNYFAGYMAGLEDKNLSYSNLIEITLEHTQNGFVPNFIHGTTLKSEDRSQPPVGSTMLLETYRRYREQWIVEYLYPMLLDWNTWYLNHRMEPTGALCWGSDPVTPQIGNIWEYNGINDTYGGALESGLDNSPMYDGIPFDKERHVMYLEDVGLTGLYIMDCQSLIELAKLLGKTEDVEKLTRRLNRAESGLMGLWDEENGFFYNRRTDTGEFSRRIAPTNFYALFSNKVTEVQARRMADEHYYNPEEFYGDWMLPSIARNDPAFPDQDYWRGRVWAPLNFLTYMALMHHDLPDVRRDLAQKSVDIMMPEWTEHRHIHENYNGDTGAGCDARNSDKFYHWGALLAVVAMLEKGQIAGFGKPL